jgi:hypothetical protein
LLKTKSPYQEELSMPGQPPEKWHDPVSRLGRGGLELLSHLGMLALILVGIKLIELLMKALWGGGRLLFGKWPLAYIVDGSDLVLIGAFLTIGIFVVLRAYYRKRG